MLGGSLLFPLDRLYDDCLHKKRHGAMSPLPEPYNRGSFPERINHFRIHKNHKVSNKFTFSVLLEISESL